jgi:hypothetical protein
MQRCKVGAFGVLLLLASGCALDTGEPGGPSSPSDPYADDATTGEAQPGDGKVGSHTDQIRVGVTALPPGPDPGGEQSNTDSSGKPQPDPWKVESGTDPSKPQPDPWQPGTKVTTGSNGK